MDEKLDWKLSAIFILFALIIVMAAMRGFINLENSINLYIFLTAFVISIFMSVYYSQTYSKDKYFKKIGKAITKFFWMLILFLLAGVFMIYSNLIKGGM